MTKQSELYLKLLAQGLDGRTAEEIAAANAPAEPVKEPESQA